MTSSVCTCCIVPCDFEVNQTRFCCSYFPTWGKATISTARKCVRLSDNVAGMYNCVSHLGQYRVNPCLSKHLYRYLPVTVSIELLSLYFSHQRNTLSTAYSMPCLCTYTIDNYRNSSIWGVAYNAPILRKFWASLVLVLLVKHAVHRFYIDLILCNSCTLGHICMSVNWLICKVEFGIRLWWISCICHLL